MKSILFFISGLIVGILCASYFTCKYQKDNQALFEENIRLIDEKEGLGKEMNEVKNTLDNALAETERTKAEMEKQSAQHEKRALELNERIQALNNEAGNLRRQLSNNVQDAAGRQRIQELENDLSILQAQLVTEQQKKAELETKLAALEDQNQKLHAFSIRMLQGITEVNRKLITADRMIIQYLDSGKQTDIFQDVSNSLNAADQEMGNIERLIYDLGLATDAQQSLVNEMKGMREIWTEKYNRSKEMENDFYRVYVLIGDKNFLLSKGIMTETIVKSGKLFGSKKKEYNVDLNKVNEADCQQYDRRSRQISMPSGKKVVTIYPKVDEASFYMPQVSGDPNQRLLNVYSPADFWGGKKKMVFEIE